jgi:hypothetical protein
VGYRTGGQEATEIGALRELGDRGEQAAVPVLAVLGLIGTGIGLWAYFYG